MPKDFLWSFMPILLVSKGILIISIDLKKLILDKKFTVFTLMIWCFIGIILLADLIETFITMSYTFKNFSKLFTLFSYIFQYFTVIIRLYKFKNFIRIIEEVKIIDASCNKLGIRVPFERNRKVDYFLLVALIVYSLIAFGYCFHFLFYKDFAERIVLHNLSLTLLKISMTTTSLQLIKLLNTLNQRLNFLNEFLDILGKGVPFTQAANWNNLDRRLILVRPCNNSFYSNLSLEFFTMKKAFNTVFEAHKHINSFYSSHILIYCFFLLCVSISTVNFSFDSNENYRTNLLPNLFLVIDISTLAFIILCAKTYEFEVRSTEVLLLEAMRRRELESISDKLKWMRIGLGHMDTQFDVLKLFKLKAQILTKIFNFGILILITGLDIRKILKSQSVPASNSTVANE